MRVGTLQALGVVAVIVAGHGCDDATSSSKPGSTDLDADSDGVPSSADCDDTNPGVGPGFTEWCDGVDNNCDGEVDEPDAADAPEWFEDEDSDGHGSPLSAVRACGQPLGFVYNSGDCDDTEPAIHPEADELCNAVDDDCDGQVDEDGATDAPTWFRDADADGYGNAAIPNAACVQPDGYVADDTDCADHDPDVFPGAPEVCDGVDNDCEGTTDGPDAADADTWFADSDGDGFGDHASTRTECVRPEGYTSDSSDCDDTRAVVYPGAVEWCDSLDNDCDGDTDPPTSADATTWYADLDADGFGDVGASTVACAAPSGHIETGTDCDDTDDTVFPGADEWCNSRDDDCNGVIDDDTAVDAPTWYADADTDGFGDASSTHVTCTQPSGHVADHTDCNDADDTIHPDATEVCDSAAVDEDCNGLSDDNDPALDRSTTTVAYLDADADGYGSADASACVPASGTVSTDGDCDDTTASIFPGAAETCDSVDEDCDGVVDNDPIDGTTWYADLDADGFGEATDTLEGCSAPSGYVADDTDCDDTDASVSPAADELCWTLLDEDCDGVAVGDSDCAPTSSTTTSDSDVRVEGGATGMELGQMVASAGDVNTDGYGDLLVAATGYGAGGTVWLLSGGPLSANPLVTAAEATITATYSNVSLGAALAGDGDLDGDGLPDFALAAPDDDTGATNAGAVHVFTGAGPVSGTLTTADASASFTGTLASERAGTALAIGDVDDDGYDDLVVGAPGGDIGGLVYVVAGATSLSGGSLADADIQLFAEHPDDSAGAAVAVVPDVDGDGDAELLVGAPDNDRGADTAGAAYLLLGPIPRGPGALGLADTRIYGTRSDQNLGVGVAGLGDTDGDGYGDVVVGSSGGGVDWPREGTASVFFGPLVPAVRESSDAGLTIYGADAGDQIGASLQPLDLDSDGYADLAIAAPDSDLGVSGGGAVSVLYGPLSAGSSLSLLTDADVRLTGSADEALGTGLGVVLDNDGDGYPELVASAPGTQVTATDEGVVYLLDGGGRLEDQAPSSPIDHTDDADGDGYTEDDGDCDDTRASMAPDLDEVCEDGLDNDCDGQDARCAPTGAWDVEDATGFEAYAPSTSSFDRAGQQVVGLGDFNGDGFPDVAVGDPFYTTGTGAVYIRRGPLTEGTELHDGGTLVRFEGENVGDYVGEVIAPAGDVNGDGYDDLLIGAPYFNDSSSSATEVGRVYLVLGSASATGSVSLASAALTITGTSTNVELGSAIAALGDIDHDGYGDIVIGDRGGTDAGGTASIFLGSSLLAAVGTDLTPADGDVQLHGVLAGNAVGGAVASAGDVDGDGSIDLLIGDTSGFGPTLEKARGGLLYYGPLTSLPAEGDAITLADVAFTHDNDEELGTVVLGGADFNADGYADVVLCSPDGDNTGLVAGFFGPLPVGASLDVSEADFALESSAIRHTGESVAVGDINADGYDDLVVGSPQYWNDGASDDGIAMLFYGPLSGSYTEADVDASFAGLDGGHTSDGLHVFDVDHDGYDDILIGSPEGGHSGSSGRLGWVGVVHGGLDSTATPVTPGSPDRTIDDDGDGFSEVDGDCDDFDAAAFPGATEVCGDGRDNDCSGGDQACAPVGTLDVGADIHNFLSGSSSSYSAGRSVAHLPDLNGDGYGDLAVGANRAEGNAYRSGVVDVLMGPIHPGGHGMAYSPVRLFGDTTYDNTGWALAAGDLDADGLSDLLVGGWNGTSSGRAFLFMGSTSVEGTYDLPSEASATLTGSTSPDGFSQMLATGDDLDGDGILDLIVSAPTSALSGTDAGAVYVFLGPVTGAVSASSADLILTGEAAGDEAGPVAFVGDVDQDGLGDFVVGAPYHDAAGTDAGRAYLWLGVTSTGTASLGSADLTLDGEDAGDLAGWSVARGGDNDGDGIDDVIIGARYAAGRYTYTGTAYWFSGATMTGAAGLAAADTHIIGSASGDYLGIGVASAGDVDADGYDDVLVTATGAASDAGEVYLFYGPLSGGDVYSADADASVAGEDRNDFVGSSLAGGDTDGDGYSDITIGAPDASYTTHASGTVYRFSGGPR